MMKKLAIVLLPVMLLAMWPAKANAAQEEAAFFLGASGIVEKDGVFYAVDSTQNSVFQMEDGKRSGWLVRFQEDTWTVPWKMRLFWSLSLSYLIKTAF